MMFETKYWMIAILIVLVCCPVYTYSQTVSQQNQSQNILSDADIADPNNWIARGGKWEFSERIIDFQGFTGCGKVYYAEEDFTDCQIEVKQMKLAEDGTFGLMLRYDELKDTGYSFMVWPHGGYMFLRFESDNHVHLIDGLTIYLNDGLNAWNTLRIECEGTLFHLYVNGYFIQTISDSTYSKGKVGLMACGDYRQLAKFEFISIQER